MKKILYGGTLVTREGIVEDKALVFDEKIIELVDVECINQMEGEKILIRGWVLPGFIDIHIHGAGGSDVMDATPEALEKISNTVLQGGTTSYLATTMAMEQEIILDAFAAVREAMKHPSGARILGIHLEGPFISPEYKGAQDAQYIQKPHSDWIQEDLDIIKIITLAPEMDENFSFIKEMKDKVILSIGHSGADYQTATSAFDAGARHITHCFNAMTGLHHREPGIVGAALTRDFTVEFITDKIHVHPDLFEPMMRVKKDDQSILITDAMRAAFLEEGEYDLGGQNVFVKDGACRLEDGTIAGSVHRMDQALRNMLDATDFGIERISRMLSYNPAKLLGIEQERGAIEAGLYADLVLLNENFEVVEVYVEGQPQLKKE